MNTLGRFFRVSLFGESHGAGVGATITGCPAGLPLVNGDFKRDMDRRRPVRQAGGTPRAERDEIRMMSGCFDDHTTGAPLTLHVANANTRARDYAPFRDQPRPGHADWVSGVKYGGFQDARGGGHFSGRMTAALVAAGVVAKKLLAPHQITIAAEVIEIGGAQDFEAALARAEAEQDTIGGLVACAIKGLPAGLGEPFFDTAEGCLAHAILAIPAVKGIEFGNGFEAARLMGSENNDAIINDTGLTATQNAGGFNGGLTNGNSVYFRVPIKPPSSTPKTQHTWDAKAQEMRPLRIKGRHDRCIALRAPVVIEAVSACVFVDLMMQAQQIPRILGAHKKPNHSDKPIR